MIRSDVASVHSRLDKPGGEVPVSTVSGEVAEGDALRVVVDGAVATVTLCRPELLNRFDAVLHREFVEAFRIVRAQPAVRAVVLASTGKVFSAGGDFAWMSQMHDDVECRNLALEEGRLLIDTLIGFPMPIVAALHGDAFGLGATVVVGCDAVVASRAASLADTHVLVGLVAGDGGCLLWPQAIGMLRAKRYLLTGDRLDAERAHAMGLVTDLVDESEEVLPASHALAGRLAALPPLAVQGTKRALNSLMQQRAGEVMDVSLAYESMSLASDDLIEALDAFRQKRAATYRGR